MNTITLEGPVVVIPEASYQELLLRVERLEKLVNQLARLAEDADDIRVMREAEIECHAGDSASFADLLAEIQSDDP